MEGSLDAPPREMERRPRPSLVLAVATAAVASLVTGLVLRRPSDETLAVARFSIELSNLRSSDSVHLLAISPDGRRLVYAADDGSTETLLPLSGTGQVSHGARMLPSGAAMLITVRNTGAWDDGRIHAYTLETGESRTILEGGAAVRYLPTGHLVDVREGTLYAAPFDEVALEIPNGKG